MTKAKRLTAAFTGMACVFGAGYAAIDYAQTRGAVKQGLEDGFATYMPDRSHHPFIKCLVDESVPGITQKHYERRYSRLRDGIAQQARNFQHRYLSAIGPYARKPAPPQAQERQPAAAPTWQESFYNALRVPVNAFNETARAAEAAIKKAGEPYVDVLQHSGTCYKKHGAPVTPRDLIAVLPFIL